jgi:hypothetical protein
VLVLVERLLHGLFVDAAALAAADGLGIDARQHAPRTQVVRILLEQIFCFGDGILEAVGGQVEFRQIFQNHGGGRIFLERQFIVLNGFGHVRATAAGLAHLLIEPAQREVVINVAGIGGGLRCGCGAGLREANGSESSEREQRLE